MTDDVALLLLFILVHRPRRHCLIRVAGGEPVTTVLRIPTMATIATAPIPRLFPLIIPNQLHLSSLPNNTLRSSSLPVPRRHTPYFGQPDYRIYELNKRLQQRTEVDSDNLWWDAFATEFFEDDASLTLAFCLEDGPKRYTIGRTLIPRYFRSIFEGGVLELYYNMKHPKESFHNTSITLDCDQCTMVTHHGKPFFTKNLRLTI
ncbi:unnamed protein product [Callosobruchus maculatus]|uniref:LIM interaction domain-containing protein n=1 Tax=Callosobruchus maculatus TaxID=64391 RepID=A0A653DW20_CALMS|nr:unnamed protein product [Callosobruchus maculatus]